MSTRVAQEITRLLADESEGRPSTTRRRAKARLVASIAEGLDRAQIADLRAGLSDGARAAFFDARLSPAERDIVITALSHDPRERAEMSSAAALLDCVDAVPCTVTSHESGGHDVCCREFGRSTRRGRWRPASLAAARTAGRRGQPCGVCLGRGGSGWSSIARRPGDACAVRRTNTSRPSYR